MSSEQPERENDELLSRTTARLLISIKDDSVTSQVREFIRGENLQRRDSAVSLTSFDDDAATPFPPANQETTSKRRRSSVQSVPQPKQKKVKKHKRKMKAMLAPPEFRVETGMDHPFKLANWRMLLLDILTGSDQHLKKIYHASNLKKVPKVVVALVPGLLRSDFSLPQFKKGVCAHSLTSTDPEDDLQRETPLPFFYDTFPSLLETTMLGSNESIFPCCQAMVSFPVSKAERKKREEELRKTKIVLYDLLVTKEQMSQNNYPLHSTLSTTETIPEGWVETKKFEHEGSHTFALDCEFCQSNSGPVLTRVSLVNFQDEVVYDTYVKPQEEITNYVTRYSGITEEILQDVTTTAQDVQEKLLGLISSDDILIGHSIESDLNVMKIRHPNVIDTSLIYDHPKGPPLKPGLRWLADKFLARSIQQGEATGEGHSSVEDLRACLDLVKMKLIEGPAFGKVLRETYLFEKVFEVHPDKRSVIIDFFPDSYGRDLGENLNVEKIPVFNDDEVVDAANRELESSSLLMLRFKELDFNSGVTSVPSKFTGKLQCELSENRTTTKLSGEQREEFLLRLNARLQKVYDSLPEHSMILVCSEGAELSEVARLQDIRRKFQQLERRNENVSDLPPEQCWDFDKQTALKQAVNEARNGISFVAFKTAPNSSESNNSDGPTDV